MKEEFVRKSKLDLGEEMNEKELEGFAVDRVIGFLVHKGFKIKQLWNYNEFIAQARLTYDDIDFLVKVEVYKEDDADFSDLEKVTYKKLKSKDFKRLKHLCRTADTVPLLFKVAITSVSEDRKGMYYKKDRFFRKIYMVRPGIYHRLAIKGISELFM